MNYYNKNRSLSVIAALLLFAVFAAGVFFVLLGGAKVYRSLVQRDAAVYDSRTCSQYLFSKLRQAPNPDAVSVSSLGGVEAIRIAQTVAGDSYVTWIYCWDGWLMELFCVADGEFTPEDGQKVLRAGDFSVTWQDDLLMISLTDGNGQTLQLQHVLRGWEETP